MKLNFWSYAFPENCFSPSNRTTLRAHSVLLTFKDFYVCLLYVVYDLEYYISLNAMQFRRNFFLSSNLI